MHQHVNGGGFPYAMSKSEFPLIGVAERPTLKTVMQDISSA